MRDEFGIKKAFLMASIGPAEVDWNYAESGAGAADVGPFIIEDPELGVHVMISDMVWPFMFFVNPEDKNNEVAANAPFEAVATEGYNGPEPLFASLQLLGLPPFNRPAVDRGIFDKTGTRLEFVAMSQDSFQTVSEQEVLYEYLTNDSRLKKFATVDSKDAVHSMYISNPRELLESLVPSNISLP